MIFLPTSTTLLLAALSWQGDATPLSTGKKCRNIPGSAGFPDATAWSAFNATISGRLVAAIPSAEFCAHRGGCNDAEWTSAVFRNVIPGAMNQVNWEQGYDLTPPSLCVVNGTTCGQGDVPLYSVEAQTVTDVQAAVKFATTHNLRVAIKSSGHDYLGRSTAPHSLLIHTNNLTNLSFTDAFFVGNESLGSAVTVGPGVHLTAIYEESKTLGRIAVGGSAATVCAAGGYLQGAGHSSLSPTFGLAADNVFEFQIVVASGELLQVNSITNTELFYALRGGGAGSWGVVVAATFRTFPTFNSTFGLFTLSAANNTAMAALATLHAQHIFDFDATNSSQYFVVSADLTGTTTTSTMTLETYMINQTVEQSQVIMAPFLTAAQALPGVAVVSSNYTYGLMNDLLSQPDDSVGDNLAMGSRLIPESTYKNSYKTAGEVYQQLLDAGTPIIFGNLIAGGKVAENANIDSAVHPAWRTAKTHLIILNGWLDSTPQDEINALRSKFKNTQLPILERMSGPNAGSYSNEADVMEADFQTTFFGPNYVKLSAIKSKYDPGDLFIVGAGVGSERWDEWGLCTV
ncbi:FAD-binding domain-containing protein [Mycena metata]|uniref:FAD-binding domain-containing protein n=1 Tax=Mycena metata TaxID=1033252 RepID=A0AAD7MRD8_9AGAR|nr:FAD-binding domain-containing protein [Mycena metata]